MSVLITFIGGPLDGEQQVVADVNTNDVMHMYHDHGTYRSGTAGRNVFSKYVYDHSDPYQPSVYGRGPYGAGPYGRPRFSAQHYFRYIDNSRGDIPEGPGKSLPQAPVGQDVPTLPPIVPNPPTLTSVAAGDTGGPSLSPGAPNWYSSHELIVNGQDLDGFTVGDATMTDVYATWQLPQDNATVRMTVSGANAAQATTILPQIVHPAAVSLTLTDPAGTSNSLPVTIIEQPTGDPGLSHWQAIENCTLMQSSTPLGGSNWYPYVVTITAAAPQAIVGFVVPVPGVITAPVSGEEHLLLAFVGHDDSTPVRWVNPEMEWWAGNPYSGGTFIANATTGGGSYEPPQSVNNSVWTSVGVWGICPDHAAHGVPYITARMLFAFMDVTPGEIHYLYGVSFGPRW